MRKKDSDERYISPGRDLFYEQIAEEVILKQEIILYGELFGARVISDGATRGFERIDPDGVITAILINMYKYGEGSHEYQELRKIYDEYTRIPIPKDKHEFHLRRSQQVKDFYRKRLRDITV